MVFYKSYLYILILILFGVWFSVFTIDTNLHIIACDVGQGDAILIQKVNTQILIDSGPNRRVLDCLGKHMPFWDRTLELVILTHPDRDHSGGLVDVFNSFKVANFLTNDLANPIFSNEYIGVLRNVVGGSGTTVIYPDEGMVIRLGMIYLDILHPSKDFVSSKTNDYSIVNLLTYGDFKAIFTGDIEDKISDTMSLHPKIQTVDYIKVPHHGSKNGLSEKLLQATMPRLAIISVGGKNNYGHPHQEVLDLLNKYKVQILKTDLSGDVEVITDGKVILYSHRL